MRFKKIITHRLIFLDHNASADVTCTILYVIKNWLWCEAILRSTKWQDWKDVRYSFTRGKCEEKTPLIWGQQLGEWWRRKQCDHWLWCEAKLRSTKWQNRGNWKDVGYSFTRGQCEEETWFTWGQQLGEWWRKQCTDDWNDYYTAKTSRGLNLAGSNHSISHMQEGSWILKKKERGVLEAWRRKVLGIVLKGNEWCV